MKDKLRELSKVERVRLFVNASDENLKIPTRVLSWLSDYADILDAEGDGGAVASGVNPDELYAQLTPFADPACRDCDGRGVFYGNVCVCGCVMTKLQATHPARSVVAEAFTDKGMQQLAEHIAASTSPSDESCLEIAYAIARHLKLEGWPVAYQGARSGVVSEATEEMCDSVRYLLVGMERPGRTFGTVREHCRFAGMDVENWPNWTLNRDTEHFNKSACAALIWWLMHRAALESYERNRK